MDGSVDGDLLDRVVGIGRVWQALHLFHPATRLPDVDVTAATLTALRRALEGDSHRAVITELLGVVGDGETKLVSAEDAVAAVPPGEDFHAIDYLEWPPTLQDTDAERSHPFAELFLADATWRRFVAGADGERTCDRIEVGGGLLADVRVCAPVGDPRCSPWRRTMLDVERIKQAPPVLDVGEPGAERTAVRAMDVISTWAIVDLFFPYRDLMDEPLDVVRDRSLATALDPGTGDVEWADALLAMFRSLGDGGHSSWDGDRTRGSTRQPEPVRHRVDGRPAPFAWIGPSGSIPYVDLERADEATMGSARRKILAEGHGILDVRGYPAHVWMWSFGSDEPCIGASYRHHGARGVAADRRHVVDASACQRILPACGPGARRPLLTVLIDDRAISQAEHTCMYLAAVADVQFVGTPTHGANGQFTCVPTTFGHLVMSGGEAAWPDGRQLQRVGIQPDVLVEQRSEHVDDVLAAAVQHHMRRIASMEAPRGLA